MMRRILCGALVIALAGSVAHAETQVPEEDITTRGAWIAYWDTESAVDEIDRLEWKVDPLVYFAALFDTDDTLLLPEELPETKALLDKIFSDTKPMTYLSVVNDLTLVDGGYTQKDTALLFRLLETEVSRSAHIDDILRVAKLSGCNGIEIDYENLGKDLTLWTLFCTFIEALREETDALSMPLRVLLQPSAPTDELTLPQGITYVMMCYNLYGTHSGPGPKADEIFLRSMVDIMSPVPQPHRYALSTGGFDWSDVGIQQLTWHQADELRAAQNAIPARDEASGNLYFNYTDEEGKGHTVWYADEETLAFWSSVLREAGGSSVDIWRLGGNVE